MALPSQAQTITVPLGTAAQFGLLSGGTLAADTASDAHVAGKAGAATAITGPVQASSNAESGSVTAALTGLAAARAYCSGLSAATLTAPLNGQTLTGGAYTLSGNVTFGAGNPLVLQGTDTTVFVINVTGNLTLTAGATVWLEGRIAPQNIVWNVSGNLSSVDYTVLPGVVMAGGNITASGIWAATSALLSVGDLTLTQVRFNPSEAGSNFFGAESLLPPAECASLAAAPVGPYDNQAANGAFEVPDPVWGALPDHNSNVCNRYPSGPVPSLKQVAVWGSANWGTPDWFKAGGTNGSGVPLNNLNWNVTPIPPHSGDSYAGLFTCRDDVNDPANRRFSREYLMQRLGANPMAAKHYYVEFYSRLAPISDFTVSTLGFRAFTDDPYKQTAGLLLTGGTTPIQPTVFSHDGSFNSTALWSRTAGAFQAVGNEQYFAIGNFDNALPTPIPGHLPLNFTEDSYQYIDDVLIQKFPEPLMNCDQVNQQLVLTVDHALPASSGALYIWTYTPPGTTVPVSQSSTIPVFLPPYPYALSYVLTIRLPLPGGGNYPDVVYPALLTSQVFAFSIDYNSPRLNIASGTTVMWNGNETVRGTVTVANGATLIIQNNAVIRFDDTYAYEVSSTLRTRLLVQRGGTLIVQNGAVLTSLRDPAHGAVPDICHRAIMWDGVTVEGRGTGTVQTTGSGGQGAAQVLTNGTIAHARIGLMAGQSVYGTQAFQGRVGNLVKESGARGGAVLTGNTGRFLECWQGVHFTSYRDGTTPNVSRFDNCLIQSTQVLADPLYQTNGVRYGTRIGLKASGTNRITLTNNIFDGFDGVLIQLRGQGIIANQATITLEATGYQNGDHTQPIGRNEIRDWEIGFFASGTALLNMALRVRGNLFTNNYQGLVLLRANGADIRYNRFEVGGPGMTVNPREQPIGLFFEESTIALPTTENVFTAHQQTTAGTYNVGVLAKNIGQAIVGGPRMFIYNNRFTNLYTGLYTFGNNTSVIFRCNDFNNPVATFGFANSNNPSADVNVHAGSPGVQGSCPQNPAPRHTANNWFTLPMTAHQHIFLRSGDQFSAQGGTPFDYFFPDPPGPRRQPSAASPSAPVQAQMLARIVGCLVTAQDTAGCGNRPEAEDAEALAAQLVQEPVGSAARADVLTLLVADLLTDPAETQGLDKAIEVLETEQNPEFADLLIELQTTKEEGMSAAGRAARPARKPIAQPVEAPVAVDLRREAAAGTASRTRANYGLRVRQLLLPLGSDSIRTLAVMTDSVLRAELQRMADDSLTRGYMTARMALNTYGGANYQPYIMEPDGGPTADDLGRAAAPPAPKLANFLLLAPNPSTGHVRVGYGLTQTAQQVTLRVYDEWGQWRGEYALTDEALAAGVTLQLRPGIYHCNLVADGKVVAKERLLINR